MEQKPFYSGIKVQSPSKTYHNYSSSSSCSTLWGGIDRIDGILFQFYLFPKNVTFNLDYVHMMPLWFENGTKSLRKGLLFTRCRHENRLKTVRNENGALIGMEWKRNSIRHRVNTCQSVTESWRYQVSGAVFKSYRHRVNGALLFFYSTSPIPKKSPKGMQPKLSWKYLIDHDSRWKNWISFIDIRNIMMLHVRKRWFWSNMTIGFPQFYSLRYKQGLRISTACCGMRKTDQVISSYSVLKSIALTRGCSWFS